MIWFYVKSGKHLRCEVRQEVERDLFELAITEPDGREHVESFLDSVLLRRRSRQLEQEWRSQGWDGPYGRDY